MKNPYMENMVSTSNPVRLVILLYERAISALEFAAEVMEKENPTLEENKLKLEELLRATDILIALDATLDMEKGGDIAKNLHEIYQALMNDLVLLSAKDDPVLVKRMVKILSDLREAWEEIEKIHYGKPQAIAT